MTLVAPDPTRAVPLPLREQAAVRDRWLTQRLLDVLPGLMDRAGIDLWLVIGREYNEDPVLATLLPATWLSARRRTILALHRSDDGVTAAAVSRYPVGQFLAAWAPEDAGRRRDLAVGRGAPHRRAGRRRGGSASTSRSRSPSPTGSSHTEHRLLTEALGPWARAPRPGRGPGGGLAGDPPAGGGRARCGRSTGWCTRSSTRPSPPPSIDVGTTTALDVAWWLRQRLHDLGVEPWFQPSVDAAARRCAAVGPSGLPAVPLRRGHRRRATWCTATSG